MYAAQADESEHFLMSKEDTIRLARWLSVPINTQSLKSCYNYAMPQAADDCFEKQLRKFKIEYDKKEQLTIFFARHGNHEAADILLEWLIDRRDIFLSQPEHQVTQKYGRLAYQLYGLIAEEDSIVKAVQAFAKYNDTYSTIVYANLAAILLGRSQQRFESLADQMLLLGAPKKTMNESNILIQVFLYQLSYYPHYPLLRQRFIDLNQESIHNRGLKDWVEQELKSIYKLHNQDKQQEIINLTLSSDLFISAAKSRDNSWHVREGVFDTLGIEDIEDIGKAED